ncbi:MAG: hypothetical protein ABJM86_05565 [Hyphomicrobiales bacterium]
MIQTELLITMYIVCAGFASAGLLGSFVQLWKTEPVGFSINYDSFINGLVGVFVCIFAGPFIIMRNTLRGRRIEGRPLGWVIMASGIASLWSFCTGLVIMHFALSIRTSIFLA